MSEATPRKTYEQASGASCWAHYELAQTFERPWKSLEAIARDIQQLKVQQLSDARGERAKLVSPDCLRATTIHTHASWWNVATLNIPNTRTVEPVIEAV